MELREIIIAREPMAPPLDLIGTITIGCAGYAPCAVCGRPGAGRRRNLPFCSKPCAAELRFREKRERHLISRRALP